jgi:hypothetical protein
MVEGSRRDVGAALQDHHALVDGVSGVDLTTMLFDLEPDAPHLESGEVWVPHPEPAAPSSPRPR